MNTTTLAIPLAFVLLAGLMCWHIATVKGKWWIKLAFIITVPSFGIVVWRAVSSYQGWPAEVEVPQKGLLLWVDVIEPDTPGHEDGAIHIWLIDMTGPSESGPLLGHGRPRGIPRAYRLAYDRKLHEMLEAAKGRIMQGQPVVLERATSDPDARQGRPGRRFSRQEADFKVYDLPPPALPRKDGQ